MAEPGGHEEAGKIGRRPVLKGMGIAAAAIVAGDAGMLAWLKHTENVTETSPKRLGVFEDDVRLIPKTNDGEIHFRSDTKVDASTEIPIDKPIWDSATQMNDFYRLIEDGKEFLLRNPEVYDGFNPETGEPTGGQWLKVNNILEHSRAYGKNRHNPIEMGVGGRDVYINISAKTREHTNIDGRMDIAPIARGGLLELGQEHYVSKTGQHKDMSQVGKVIVVKK